jgi:ABC-2 type transport system permease protein
VSPYLAQLSANLRVQLSYRMAALAGVVTQAFWGFLRLSILTGFYAALPVGAKAPMSEAQLASYVWLGQGLWALMPLRADAEVAALVREGGIANELTRPVDLYSFWLSRAVALRLGPTLLRWPVLLLVGTLLPRPEWCLRAPPSLTALLLFLASVTVALLLSAAFTTLLGVTCLWTQGGNGIGQLLAIVGVALSGIVLPLPLYPDAVRSVLELLPFAALSDLPLRMYSGHLSGAAAGWALARSGLWATVFVAFGWFSLRASLSRVVSHGG